MIADSHCVADTLYTESFVRKRCNYRVTSDVWDVRIRGKGGKARLERKLRHAVEKFTIIISLRLEFWNISDVLFFVTF